MISFLFVGNLGRLIKDRSSFFIFLMFNTIGLTLLVYHYWFNTIDLTLLVKDILRTFYPQFWQIWRTSRGKNFLAGPYLKKSVAYGADRLTNQPTKHWNLIEIEIRFESLFNSHCTQRVSGLSSSINTYLPSRGP